jgi:hypothetical protein
MADDGETGAAAVAAHPADARWQQVIDEHAAAVAALGAAARRVPPAAWLAPRHEGAWSPAQIVEHVALAIDAFAMDLGGGTKIRARVGTGWQRVLRWVVLPHILFHRSLPLRARAPREARPADRPGSVEEVVAALDAAWARLAAEAVRSAGRPGAEVMHPYFGSLPALRALRFSVVHVEHHRRQVEA